MSLNTQFVCCVLGEMQNYFLPGPIRGMAFDEWGKGDWEKIQTNKLQTTVCSYKLHRAHVL